MDFFLLGNVAKPGWFVTFSQPFTSCVHEYSVRSKSLWPHRLYPTRLSAHATFQARILEWVAISFSRESSRLRDWTQTQSPVSPSLAGRFSTTEPSVLNRCYTIIFWLHFSLQVCRMTTLVHLWQAPTCRLWLCQDCPWCRVMGTHCGILRCTSTWEMFTCAS